MRSEFPGAGTSPKVSTRSFWPATQFGALLKRSSFPLRGSRGGKTTSEEVIAIVFGGIIDMVVHVVFVVSLVVVHAFVVDAIAV